MIGVIGGNGVAATNKLCSLIEEQLTLNGAFRDAHHPEMVIFQATQAPSRSMYLEGRGPSWIEDYVEVGKKLKACGCDELCMCCNTAHYAVEELAEKINIKFVNLLDLVAKRCHELGVRKIGMMCSDGLRKVGLYEKRFAIYAPKVAFVYPDEEFQELVTKGICGAKSKIRFTNPQLEKYHPYNCFAYVCEHLRYDKGVDCIVAGCTDICNVYTPKGECDDCKYVDSLRVLADYIVKEHSQKITL